jgi:glycosyltransferase involved in cell wall biosynthesis
VVHASDIEGALACVAVKLLRPNLRIVFNIHDNLAQRYNVPGWLKSFFLATEGLVARCCDVTLLPDRGRLECMGRFRPRCYRLIPNTPEDPGFVDLEQNVPPLRACLVGWLDWCRGVDVAERLLEKIPAMELVVAGNGPAEVEQHLRGLPRTRYLGFLPHQQVLELMRQCHIVLAFYDPGKEINRYASPNKVGDALAVGRPLLMNSEVALSAELTRTGCVFASPYHDLDAMAETLRKLIADPRLLSDLNRTARGVYEREFHWDRYRAEIREVFVELLSLGTKSSTGRESRLLKERGHAGSPA